jgi:hypothetical protein
MMVDTLPKNIQTHHHPTPQLPSQHQHGNMDIRVLVASSSSSTPTTTSSLPSHQVIIPKVHYVYEGSGETEQDIPQYVKDKSIATVQLSRTGQVKQVYSSNDTKQQQIHFTGQHELDNKSNTLLLHAATTTTIPTTTNNPNPNTTKHTVSTTTQVDDNELKYLLDEFQNRHSQLGSLLLDTELRDLMCCCSSDYSAVVTTASKQQQQHLQPASEQNSTQHKRRSKSLPKLNIAAIGPDITSSVAFVTKVSDNYNNNVILTPKRELRSSPYCDQPMSPFTPNTGKMKPLCNLVSPYKCSFPLQDIFKGLTPTSSTGANPFNIPSPSPTSTNNEDLLVTEFERAMASLRDTLGKISANQDALMGVDSTCRQENHRAKRRITFT